MDDLAHRADLNLAAARAQIAQLAGGSTERFDTLQLTTTGIRAPFFNGAYVFAATQHPEASVARATEFMAEADVPWLLWAREGVDDRVLAVGRGAGLREQVGPPAMGLPNLTPAPPPPRGLEIRLATTEADIDAAARVTAQAYDGSIELARRLTPIEAIDRPDIGVMIARVDGEPVSAGVLQITGSTAGIYNVGTPPEHRRRGYGAAITWAALDEGRRRGCDHGVLQASDAGISIYEAMGFVRLGTYIQLEGPAVRDSPQ